MLENIAACLNGAKCDEASSLQCLTDGLDAVFLSRFKDTSTRATFFEQLGMQLSDLETDTFEGEVRSLKQKYLASGCSKESWEKLMASLKRHKEDDVVPRVRNAADAIDESSIDTYRPWGRLKLMELAIDVIIREG